MHAILVATFASAGGNASKTNEPAGGDGQPQAGRLAFASDRDGIARIYIAKADGSGATALTIGEAPAWSPDANRIAFHRETGVGPAEIHVIDVDGSDERFLGQGGHPSWSPDGTRIVFNGDFGISVMNADGSHVHRLLSHEFVPTPGVSSSVFAPVWSPDGGRIAFVRANFEDPWEIYVMNADGSSPSRRGGNWTQSEPAWSPNGSRIAFETAGSGGHEVASIHSHGSGFQRHVTEPSGYVGNPDWSPDGRSLVFVRSSPLGAPTRIFVVDANGSMGQLIPDAVNPAAPGYRDYAPAWSRATAAPEPLSFYTVAPCRVMDTRDPQGPHGGPALAAGNLRAFVIAGQCGIPLSAKVASMNVTVTTSTTQGSLSLYSGGTPLPLASAINYRPGQTRANNAIIQLGAGGNLAVFCGQGSGTTHLIIDVNGYFE